MVVTVQNVPPLRFGSTCGSRAPAAGAASARPRPCRGPRSLPAWAALDLGHSYEGMRRTWKEITVRDPHHYGAHCAALQYWCAKWRDSEEAAVSFAREAAAGAPLGGLLTALPLIAWYERRDDDAEAAVFREPYLVALIGAALADVAAAPPDRPDTAAVRHLLACFLPRQGRYDAALEQFRLVDGYVDALPWRHGDDPAAVYCLRRDRAVRGASRC